MEYRGIIYTSDGEFKKGIVTTEDEIITDITFDDSVKEDTLIIPGLIDLHLHGADGYDISDGTIEAFDAINNYEKANGIVAYCGATMTIPDDEIINVLEIASNYRKPEFKGIYLEGPFISKEYCGAQRKDCIVVPNKELVSRYIGYRSEAGSVIRQIVIAPEEIKEEGLIEYIVNNKIHCSIGHTAADYNEARNAFDKGASEVTHLYNAMREQGKRNPGVPGAAFDANSYVELIADGNHVNDTILRMAFKIYDEDKILLISDSMRATGKPDGEYTLGGQNVAVSTEKSSASGDNQCESIKRADIRCAKLKDGTLAGSVVCLLDCLKYAISIGIPMDKAIKAATINPAKRLGIDNMYGSIEIGKYHPIALSLA